MNVIVKAHCYYLERNVEVDRQPASSEAGGPEARRRGKIRRQTRLPEPSQAN